MISPSHWQSQERTDDIHGRLRDRGTLIVLIVFEMSIEDVLVNVAADW
jgi:hypothetical protein